MALRRSYRDTSPYRYSEEEYSNEHEEYDCFGKTPPRTKLLRKYREKRNRDKENFGVKHSAKMTPTRKTITRRNTVTSIFDELIMKAENPEMESKRSDKRNLKQLRGSERDLKLDIASAQAVCDTHTDTVPVTPQSRQIESSSRFRCLSSRPVAQRGRPQPRAVTINFGHVFENDEMRLKCPDNRVEFHATLSLLIHMGCDKPKEERTERNPRRHMSREETIWQNELKDLIWLELQAWHAGRSISDEDTFLCTARENVPILLDNIMKYCFQRNRKHSVISGDSGIEIDCSGCLSMYCQTCMEAQNEALKEVEDLLSQLESVESLFSSSKAFAEIYPLYKDPKFIGRVKAMCLWYNMTSHQRLKLVILGKLLALLEHADYQWPIQFERIDSCSPSDSNSSNSSMNDYLYDKNNVDMYNTTPIASLVRDKTYGNISPYRKYIENILKTKGLGKSMSFLDRLHVHVLRKARITLEKPRDFEIFNRVPGDNETDELLRYGSWSPEARSLQLPSYKSAFLFLAEVPLEVVHEFLKMRLDQKPEKPSPLSIRQLMRELKEGIRIAAFQRENYLVYLRTVLDENASENIVYKKIVDNFDGTLAKVMTDYLEYIGAWALLQHDTFQKSLLEEEWKFICDSLKDVTNCWEMAVNKFCAILGSMAMGIAERLIEKIEELALEMSSKEDELNRKQNLFAVCREFQSVFTDAREMSLKVILFAKSIFRSGCPINNLEEFKSAVVHLRCAIPKAIDRVQQLCDAAPLENMDESEKASLASRYRELLTQGFRYGFEFHKEVCEFVPAERKGLLGRSMVQFATLWMKYTQERCERGRGKRPRWAYQGLDFLLTVCEPQYTMYLTDEEFEELKQNMDACISHVIGTTAPTTPDSGFHSASPRPSLELNRFPRSRGSSPNTRPTYRSQRSATRKISGEKFSPLNDQDNLNFPVKNEESLIETLTKIKHAPAQYAERVKEAVHQLDDTLDDKLRSENLIGQVKNKEPVVGLKHIRKRNVTFSWQRGIKIGQGRFGKVYTAVNNDTGEMMAVKEIALQHNDISMKKVTEEIKIMEGISHKHLVKYYGLEIHKEEMLIFMEFCPEGTLESLVASTENGLPELLIRRYTFQLISGILVLHEHGIVHRDIKTANIFLSDEGNCLKIGDFGCAVKIKSHVTMPGELQGFVGTQAYMAPEMFMKSTVDGHGRAADIWSAGCVIVEMASGKRPWYQYDSNFQIMFKVGMGQSPEVPDSLPDEGHDLLSICFQHDPRKRATAMELFNHSFVKVVDDL